MSPISLLTERLNRLPGYSVQLVRSVDEVETLRTSWIALQPHPYADIDCYLDGIHEDVAGCSPHVVVVSRAEGVETMLIGKVKDLQIKYSLCNAVVFRTIARELRIIDEGVIGNRSDENMRVLFMALNAILKQRVVDIVSFKEIPLDSNIFRLSRSIPGFLSRDWFPDTDLHYKMTMPESLSEFFRQRGGKKNMQRAIKKLNNDFPEGISFKFFRKREQIDEFCQSAETISKKSFQHAFGQSFESDDSTKKFLISLAEKGMFCGYVLFINNVPAAYFAGFHHKKTWFFIPYGTGYDPEFRKYSIGTLLMFKMIEDLCIQKESTGIDFGWMDTAYKRRFCDICWEESCFLLYQPTFRGLRLNSLNALAHGVRKIGFAILKRLRIDERWERFKRKQTVSRNLDMNK